MSEQWQELKETITELRDNDGTSTQQEVCKFLTNYMDILEKQAEQEPKTDYKAFTEWVANEIFSEEWEFNKDSFAEIACRKLAEMGIVKADGDKWVLESENKE